MKQNALFSLLLLITTLFCSDIVNAQNFTINHGPYLQAVGENDATVVWTTTNDAVSWLELAPAGNESFYAEEHPKYFETTNGSCKIGRLHKIHIAGLEKGKEYRYRIFSKEVTSYEGNRIIYGKIVSTDVFHVRPLRFKTLNSSKGHVEFLMVNDIHGNVDTLKNLLKNVKYGQTDLVLFNGDMISSAENEQQLFDGFMQPAIDQFAQEVPIFYTRGNHETRGRFSALLPNYFASNTGKLYYTFREGPVFFIVLDCGEDKPDADIEYSELAHFDEYRTEEQKWLDQILETSECRSAPFRVVVIHIPPYGTDWHGARDIRTKFLPLLNNANIDIMLCGHTHRYAYIEPKIGQLNFPILINAANTSLEVKATNDKIVIESKSTQDKLLYTHTIIKKRIE